LVGAIKAKTLIVSIHLNTSTAFAHLHVRLFLPSAMAYQERPSSASSQEKEPKPTSYALDERRRAALAEVDNAKFSYANFELE
jgi:hypothetical protein